MPAEAVDRLTAHAAKSWPQWACRCSRNGVGGVRNVKGKPCPCDLRAAKSSERGAWLRAASAHARRSARIEWALAAASAEEGAVKSAGQYEL